MTGASGFATGLAGPEGPEPHSGLGASRGIPDAVRNGFERLNESVREDERARIVFWLVQTCADIEKLAAMSKWRVLLWAGIHPVRFGIAAALAEVGTAINRNEHREVFHSPAQGGVTEGRDGEAGSGPEGTSTRSSSAGCALSPSNPSSPTTTKRG